MTDSGPSQENMEERDETDRNLARRIRAGDETARQELVEKYMPFAYKMAFRYKSFSSSFGIEDLMQEACVGLIKATRRWDPDISSFMTYAKRWVNNAIWRFVEENRYTVHVPRQAQEKLRELTKSKSGDSDEALPDTAKAARVSFVSYDNCPYCSEAQSTESDYDFDYDGPAPALIKRRTDREIVQKALAKLTPKERGLVEFRFVHEMTLEETADALCECGLTERRLTREGVRVNQKQILHRRLPQLIKEIKN